MKKLSLITFLLLGALTAHSQNIRLLYDAGKGRDHLISTVEGFHVDNLGITFYFIDFEFADGGNPSMAYTEVSRTFNYKETPFSFHVEYNGGLLQNEHFAAPIKNSYLAGLDYGWASKDFTKFLNLKILYKYVTDIDKKSYQITGVWVLNFYNNKLTLTGFVDLWKEDNIHVFLTKPQFWYNLNNHFSIGGQVEINNNFAGSRDTNINPSIGLKYNIR